MSWLQSIDERLFRVVNTDLSNPVFDAVMPYFSDNFLFGPLLLGIMSWLLWRGSTKAKFFVLLVGLSVGLTDPLVHKIKKEIKRERPMSRLGDVNLRVGNKGTGRGSMPSSHASNWFAALVILYPFYRRALKLLLPTALIVCFSRVYNGAHFPSDVFAGILIGTVMGLVLLGLVWLLIKKLFPASLGSLGFPPDQAVPATHIIQGVNAATNTNYSKEDYAFRGGYVFIGILLVARLLFLAVGKLELTEDESYQWLWSKNLDWSYFSKPPMIAYTQFLGTAIWGDTAFGVRFFSPVLAAGVSLMVFTWLSKVATVRAAWAFLLMTTATPLLAGGAILMTVDPLNVFFWSAAMVAGWHAIEKNHIGYWLATGLLMGLSFLSKYTAVFQLISFGLFFYLWPRARHQFRRPGPYLAVILFLIAIIPVIYWNARHDWITVKHVSANGQLDQPWEFTLRHMLEFVGSEVGLLNPIFFVAMIWAGIAFWKRYQKDQVLLYCFAMGAPVFVFYLLYSLRSRILPNWIALSVVPLFCLAAIYWERRFTEGRQVVKKWFVAALVIAIPVIVVIHDTDILYRTAVKYIPFSWDIKKLDPTRRARGYVQMATLVEDQRQKLEKEWGETFIVANHYGLVGQISFYHPEAKKAVQNGSPFIFYMTRDHPANQFYFWPGYRDRIGQNAIYVDEISGKEKKVRLPQGILNEFESVTELGVFPVMHKKEVMRRVRLFACRNLLETPKTASLNAPHFDAPTEFPNR